MKLKIVALGCLLVACGGSDRSAQNPSLASTTSAPSDSNMDATKSRTDTSVTGTTPSTASNDHSASDHARMNSGTTGATGTTGMNSGSNSASRPDPVVAPAPAPAPAATPSPAGVKAVNNPGVADQTKNADNTKINDRDRHGALTPGDTGGSKGERDNVASIRRAVVGDKSLSITAKNVKIIVTGSKVTLRGTVKSDQEKSSIEAHAKQAGAGITEVDNQLEVKK